jgi:hypothetical protein
MKQTLHKKKSLYNITKVNNDSMEEMTIIKTKLKLIETKTKKNKKKWNKY